MALIYEDTRMLKECRIALGMLLLVTVLTGLLYPLLVTGLAQFLFPEQANGSLIRDAQGQVRGSFLLAQPFTGDAWFHSRPSAGDFATLPSAASNLAPTNPALYTAVQQRAAALGADATRPAPMALVMASGSGLDPDLPPQAAIFQVARIAQARHLSAESLLHLIEKHREHPGIGPDVVKVVTLNQALLMQAADGTRHE